MAADPRVLVAVLQTNVAVGGCYPPPSRSVSRTPTTPVIGSTHDVPHELATSPVISKEEHLIVC